MAISVNLLSKYMARSTSSRPLHPLATGAYMTRRAKTIPGDYPVLDRSPGLGYPLSHVEAQRVDGPLPDRGRLQGVPERAAVAEGRRVPPVRQPEGLCLEAPGLALAVPRLRQEGLPLLRHHGNRVREHKVPAADMVHGRLHD